MNVIQTAIPGLLILEPKVFGDARGFFMESYNAKAFHDATGLAPNFVQDNHSRSGKGVLRGLHYQIEQAQGKLVRVTRGSVFDVAVDLRRASPTFGQWAGVELSEENNRQLWIPPGFAHGFQVLSDEAFVLYKCTAPYVAGADRAIAWDDPDLAIPWPLADAIVSPRDAAAPRLRDAPVLPR